MNKSQEFMKEMMDATMTQVPIEGINEVEMGDEVVFKDTDVEKNLRGLKGHVRGIRNNKLDIYVGSSLRAEIEMSRVLKLEPKK